MKVVALLHGFTINQLKMACFRLHLPFFWRKVLVFIDLKVDLKDASNMEKLGFFAEKRGCYAAARDSFWVANSWYLCGAFREGIL